MSVRGIPILAWAQAAAAIAIAKIWLRASPGRAVRWATHRDAGSSRVDASVSARAIAAIGARYPLRASCLEQGLALVIWLSAARVPSRLVVGVTRADLELRAHAWVECGGTVILGGGPAAEFAPLTAAAL